MARPLVAVPSSKREGSFLGSHAQSTKLAERCKATGVIKCHQVAGVQRGTMIVALKFCVISFLHIFYKVERSIDPTTMFALIITKVVDTGAGPSTHV
jgi:hypothetical protein